MIEAKGLSYWYGKVLALNNVSVSIAPGITGLVGPNGSGKTTFMRLMAGLIRPVAGEIRVLGERPWSNTRLSPRFGYAPEAEIGFQKIRGHEFVEFVLRMKGVAPAEASRRTRDILDRTHSATFASKSVSVMSRGMKQRIKLAAALALEPEVMILDEPLMGADPVARAEILSLIREHCTGERAVIMSTHVLQEIEELTEQIVLLHRGHLLAQGKIHEIRALIDNHPHEVRIVTSAARPLAALLARENDVRSIHVEDGTVLVRTTAPQEFYSKLTRLVAESDLPVTEVTSPDDNLEAVFRYLTER